MTPSFGEIQSTALKAARGAGLPWGLCEEAGAAVRWCWVHGLDGIGALAAVLEAYDPAECPLSTGVALADASGTWQGSVRAPILLLGVLRGLDVTVRWSGGGAILRGGDISMTAAPSHSVQHLQILTSADDLEGVIPLQRVARREVDAQAWSALKRLEGRTYAPATEASRAGAGAGLTDND